MMHMYVRMYNELSVHVDCTCTYVCMHCTQACMINIHVHIYVCIRES